MCEIKVKNIGNVYIQYSFGKFIKFEGDYFYNKELQEGVNNILFPDEFTSTEEFRTAIKYFKQFQDSKVIVKLIARYIENFKDKNKVDELLKQEVLKCFNGIIEKDFEKYNINLSRFADVYITRKIRQNILEAYDKIKSYSEFVCQNI